jgi:hypothetical protein
MKKLMYFCAPLLAVFLLATPAAARKNRSNKGGAERGDARADQVQPENKAKDKDPARNPDNDKNRGKHKGETKGEHKAKGHRQPLHRPRGGAGRH